MNLILLEPHELGAGDSVRLVGRRAEHLHRVLRVAPGVRLRIGILDGSLGEGEVVALDDGSVTLRCHMESTPPPRPRDVLLLAVPRPKVLRRVLEHAAALGFGHILLFRTWRVDKSHLSSRALEDEAIEHHLRRGLEQARRTHRPTVRRFPLFRPFVEDELEELVAGCQCFLAHPGEAPSAAALEGLDARPFAVAVGPEGGFIPFECDLLAARDFRPLSLGPHPLRVETAVAVLHAQLALQRDLGTGLR